MATQLRSYKARKLSYTARKQSYLESVATQLRGYGATTWIDAKLGARYFFTLCFSSHMGKIMLHKNLTHSLINVPNSKQ